MVMRTDHYLLEDFEQSTVYKINSDLSKIMSLTTAFDILVSCENSNQQFNDLSQDLKQAVIEGIDEGIDEVEKIKSLLEKYLRDETSNRERVYLYELIRVFSFLSRSGLVAEAILKGRNSTKEKQVLNNAVDRLGELSYNLRELRRKKRIKNTELAELRLGEVMRQMNDSIFENWISTVNELERQEHYGS